MFELEKMARRLGEKAVLLGFERDDFDPDDIFFLDEHDDDVGMGAAWEAIDHALGEANEVQGPVRYWISYFQSIAIRYLERLSQEQSTANLLSGN